MREKLLEKKLREGVRALGGLALKFAPIGHTGWPDRIVLLPGGKTLFVELKTTGAKLRPAQEQRIRWLTDNGFDAYMLDDQHKLDFFMERVKNEIRPL